MLPESVSHFPLEHHLHGGLGAFTLLCPAISLILVFRLSTVRDAFESSHPLAGVGIGDPLKAYMPASPSASLTLLKFTSP